MEKYDVVLTLSTKEFESCEDRIKDAGYTTKELSGKNPVGVIATFERDIDKDLADMSKVELMSHAKANYIIELRRPVKEEMKEKLGLKKKSTTISKKAVYDGMLAAGIDKNQAARISGYEA